MSIQSPCVVVQAGSRDYYQVPLALYEDHNLYKLVTELYWPADQKWFQPFRKLLPESIVAARYCEGLSSQSARISMNALAAFAVMSLTGTGKLRRYKDRALGKLAGTLARSNNIPLFSYSSYAYDAFQSGGNDLTHRFVFQLHPHATSVRNILQEELERVPQAADSINFEYEMSLSEQEFVKLSKGPELGNGWVVASSYTAQTLVDNGISRDQIHIVPYGIDHNKFPKRALPANIKRPFKIIFVGRMVQRKGLSYLLEAVRLLNSKNIHVSLCGRGFCDHNLLNSFSDVDFEVKRNLPIEQLVHELHQADIFVLPSLAEGFAHVILEAMSCGLPIITSLHTCAPDVINDGEHGFIVPIRDAESLAVRLAWAVDHRVDLFDMGERAAKQAAKFTWSRFRHGIRDAYQNMLNDVESSVSSQ
jgi:glycosyltransferase involved in cell wall biosynthesis